jgi:type I restriction enzyme S subunit
MVSEWKEYTIDELKADVKNAIAMGPFGSRIKAENFVKSGIPVIKGGNLNGTFLNESGFDYLTKEKADELRASNAFKRDIVITHRGTIGQVGIIPDDSNFERYVVSQSQLKISLNEQVVNPYFVYYFFKTPLGQHRLLLNTSQVGVPAIAKASTSIKEIKINIPSLPEQNRIVKNIKILDDKIELNRQMNQTLEQMAQALFKSWFVDFDPVLDNAIAAGNKIPDALKEKAEKRTVIASETKQSLPNHIQKLFPSEFEFNEELDKWIPKGWDVKNVSEVANVIGGGTPSTKVDEYFCEKGIAWLSPKDLSGYEWKFIGKGATDITELGLSKSSAKLMPKGTVLFSSRAPIGYIAIAENEISTNQGFKSLVPKEKMSSEFLYYFLKNEKENIEAIATGSTFKEVSGTALKNYKILVPNEYILKEYEKQTIDFNSKRLINQKEVISLTQLRDTLLPKLISGEVRIPNN